MAILCIKMVVAHNGNRKVLGSQANASADGQGFAWRRRYSQGGVLGRVAALFTLLMAGWAVLSRHKGRGFPACGTTVAPQWYQTLDSAGTLGHHRPRCVSSIQECGILAGL